VRVRHVRSAAADRVQEELRVEPERMGERDRLRERLEDSDEPGVENELEALTRPRFAEPERLAADRVEDRRAHALRIPRP
jgi:hypothetical protein